MCDVENLCPKQQASARGGGASSVNPTGYRR